MLKVYTVRSYVSVDDGEWYEVGRCQDVIHDDSNLATIAINNRSFNEWCKFLQEQKLSGIYYTTTFFRKKPCIVTYTWSYCDDERYTHFNTLSYKTVYEEMPNVSLDYIMKHFSADKCIQYLKERGMTACPMNF